MIIKTSYPFMKPPPSARLIRGHRLGQGLAGCWSLNEGAGIVVNTPGYTINDLSGNNYQTTLKGTNDTYWFWEPSIHGTSLRALNSATVALYWPSHGLVNSGGAIVTWINYNSLIGGTQYLTGSNFDRLYIYRVDARLWLRFGNSATYDTGFDFSANTWYHFAVTWAGAGNGTAKVYINAIEVASTDYVGFDVLTSDFCFGDSTPGGTGGIRDASFSQILFYNRTPFASEISELYWKSFCMFERKARTALMSGYEVVIPPVGMAGAMTTNTGYWGY